MRATIRATAAAHDRRMDDKSRGRPRRWKNAAERSRAYRAAKARDFAEPIAVRREAQRLRVEITAARRALKRERRRAEGFRLGLAQAQSRALVLEKRARERLARLEGQNRQLRRRVEMAEGRAERLAQMHLRLARSTDDTTVTAEPRVLLGLEPGPLSLVLNRARRREAEPWR